MTWVSTLLIPLLILIYVNPVSAGITLSPNSNFEFAPSPAPACSLTVSMVMDSSVTCKGSIDGGATASPSGGTTPYTYAWSNSANTASITGVAAGTYYVTITDSASCSVVDSVVITEPTALVATAAVNAHVDCFGELTGQASVSATGGSAASAPTSPILITEINAGTPDYIEIMNVSSSTVDVTGMKVVVSDSYTAIGTANTTTWNLTGTMASGNIQYREDVGTTHYWGNNLFWNNPSNSWAIIIDSTGKILDAIFWGWDSASIANFSITVSGKTVNNSGNYAWSGKGFAVNPACNNAFTREGSEDHDDVSDWKCKTGTKGTKNTGITTPFTGALTYAYSWSNGDSSGSLFNVAAGTYTVTVSDTLGCSDTSSVTITGPASGLVATAQVDSNVSCKGFADGGASASGTGGSGIYTYSWSNGIKIANLVNLDTGQYMVTVTDTNGCTSSDTITITQPAGFTVNVNADSNVTGCFGNQNGKATIQASGGVGSYSYKWSTGDTSQSVSGLAAGTYYVTVNDNTVCPEWDSVKITEPDPILLSLKEDSAASCFGTSDGVASANSSGGTGTHSYLWSNNDTSSFANGLAAGTHSVTVTDANGCTLSDTISITQPTAIQNTFTIDSIITCNGFSNGQISADPSGGTAGSGGTLLITEASSDSPDYIEISNVGKSTIDLTGIEVVVSNNYTNISTVNTTTWKLSGTMASGAIDYREDVTTGGKYWGNNLLWNPGSNSWAIIIDSTGKILDALFWGWDSTSIANFSINIGGKSVSNSGAWVGAGINSSCATGMTRIGSEDQNNSNDWSCVATTKGTKNTGIVTPFAGSYAYSWSHGDSVKTIDSLSAGTYVLTITDNEGCTLVDSISITQPSPLVATASVVKNVSCSGAKDGEVSASGSGGTGSYSYAWSNGGQTASLNKLAGNNYLVTVTDSLGCEAIDSASVYEPAQLVVGIDSIFHPECNGDKTGYIRMNLSGGTRPFTYSWGHGGTDSTVSGQGPGIYLVTITHANGCTDWQNFQLLVKDITHPTAMGLDKTLYLDQTGKSSITIADVDNGSFDNCGVANRTLSKMNFSCQDTGLNRVAFDVFDSSGNRGTDTLNITVLDTITPQFDFCPSDTMICRNDDNGNNYVYPIFKGSDNCSFTITQTSGLGIGHLYPKGVTTNTYVITDASGNSRTCSWDIKVGPYPKVDLGADQDICGDEKVTLTAPGNSTIIRWQNDGSSGTEFVAPDQGDGQIVVTVEDSLSGCMRSDTVMINYSANCLSVDEKLADVSTIQYYPNPNDGNFTLQTEGLSGPVVLTITDLNGKVVQTLNWEEGAQLQHIPLSLPEVESGMYLLILRESRGQAVHRISVQH
ncbi:T9SS type A sorting domain-containing protein [bacterium SCSIO 12741]|nr:T9SS type A sorting domain-containing protein [bacterium SCSIO 12741]